MQVPRRASRVGNVERPSRHRWFALSEQYAHRDVRRGAFDSRVQIPDQHDEQIARRLPVRGADSVCHSLVASLRGRVLAAIEEHQMDRQAVSGELVQTLQQRRHRPAAAAVLVCLRPEGGRQKGRAIRICAGPHVCLGTRLIVIRHFEADGDRLSRVKRETDSRCDERRAFRGAVNFAEQQGRRRFKQRVESRD